MPSSSPLLTFSNTILWLKVTLTAASWVLLYFRYRKGKKSAASIEDYPFRTKVMIGLAVLFSFAVFHNLGQFRGQGTFVHHGEMFHYYLGSKYFKELGYYELYNAVIVADAEQDSSLVGLPFYTDLRSYQNTHRDIALSDAGRVRSLFSRERWTAFKDDVSFFKKATGMPRSPGLFPLLMDHGYNASPASTFVLGTLTNAVPVTQLRLLAALDWLLVATMIALVFRTFGFDTGALFSIFFFVNILNAYDYISGSLLRYDWLLYIVAAVCLLERGRQGWSAFFLTLSAMMRIFPGLLFFGVAVTIIQRARTTGAVDRKSLRFILAAGATGLLLFLLPAASLGAAVRPWHDFFAKTELHDRGVYVNHLGLRGIVLFEPSHLSLERFAETYNTDDGDIVRHWQDVKEKELRHKRPALVVSSLFVLLCLAAIIWKRRSSESESILWPLPLIYAATYLSHYYYAFLCLFILLFLRRTNPFSSFVPICLLLIFNMAALVTDYFGPSPIAAFTLVNIYLFICLLSILGFELYTNVFTNRPTGAIASSGPVHAPRRDEKRRRRQARARGK